MSVSRSEMLRRVQKIAEIPLIDWDGCVAQVKQLHEVLLENFQWRAEHAPTYEANGSFAAIKVGGIDLVKLRRENGATEARIFWVGVYEGRPDVSYGVLCHNPEDVGSAIMGLLEEDRVRYLLTSSMTKSPAATSG